MTTITVEVVPYGQGGEGPFRAGMALVKLDGKLIAKLRTTESIEIEVGKPQILTSMSRTHPAHPSAERRWDGDTVFPDLDMGSGPHVGTDGGGELC